MSEQELRILEQVAQLSQEICALRAENKILKETNERLFKHLEEIKVMPQIFKPLRK